MERNCLVLNTEKTKELILDFRKKAPPLKALHIKGAVVQRVDSFKVPGLAHHQHPQLVREHHGHFEKGSAEATSLDP